MENRLRRFQKARTLVLSAATLTLLWLPSAAHTQSTAPQERQAAPGDQDRQAVAGDDARRELARFDQFLDSHREIAEQVRKDPSLLDSRTFVQSHPALESFLRDNPGIRDQIRRDPNAFMQRADLENRDLNQRDRDAGRQANLDNRNFNPRDDDAGRQDADRRNGANFNRFLDEHREIGDQVRRDPSLLDNRTFVQSHPALDSYLRDNPGDRDQIRRNPNAFMQQADLDNRDFNQRGRDPMHDHMADFGGFLASHSDIRRDVSRDPNVVKDHQYLQNHAELNTYLNAHPDVQADLMANPQNFVRGAQQYNGTQQYNNNGSATGTTNGAGVNDHSTGTSGTSTGTSTNPSTTTHAPTPKS